MPFSESAKRFYERFGFVACFASRPVNCTITGRGKRGGARVIYYYHNERLPVFLLAACGKNEKANLSMAERNAMKRLIPALVAGYPAKD